MAEKKPRGRPRKKTIITAEVLYRDSTKNFRKTEKYSELRISLRETNKLVSNQKGKIIDLENEFARILKKQNKSDFMEALPIESLRDMYNRDYKVAFKDIVRVGKLQKEYQIALEQLDELVNKAKLIKIEMLEHKIKFLINDNNQNKDSLSEG